MKAVAALTHANILAIHDFGTDRSMAYAVMELLDGETLRGASRGRMAWRKAVGVAIQIADGLAAAHAKGIVHRDLKPENVFLTGAGREDPRLRAGARPGHRRRGGARPWGRSPRPGTLMGTVGYMSPEQVRGEEAGPSSDIFSFGCVLYEMLAGRAPFTRSTAAESLAAVLRDDPAPLAGNGATCLLRWRAWSPIAWRSGRRLGSSLQVTWASRCGPWQA